MKMGMSRVEGDLEIKVEVDGHTVTDAWCVGTMYRGFEQILAGRDPKDALVITPRICGICSTSHLYAATTALEMVYQCPVAPNGIRIRNLCLMAEAVMNDARHTFLMFAPDLCNKAYKDNPLYEQILASFAPPFQGTLARETVEHTKRILGVVISFGGQWPHSAYMMPGGVTCPLSRSKLDECLALVDSYTAWYERSVLGCSSERWLAIKTAEQFNAWLEASESHRNSAVGLLTRFCRSIGLPRTGTATPNLLSHGCYYDPEIWQPASSELRCLLPGGFYNGRTKQTELFSHEEITESVGYSWYADCGDRRHPWDGETVPDYRPATHRYSFAKAPRYKGEVVQLGPLADMVLCGDPLIRSFFEAEGPNTWLRQFARLHRPVVVLQLMRQHVGELITHLGEPTYVESEPAADGRGYGLINAARGTLGHWVTIKDGKILNYQVITPTTWNGSPRDSSGKRGHWEESLVGLEIKDLENPVELSHVIRSHDSCLVCTVHFARTGKRMAFPFW
jgi:hydrogenase large subunit